MSTEAMRRPLELRFSEESFTVRPFTVDQVLALERLFSADGAGEATKPTALQQARDALRIALSEDHPDVKVDKVRLHAMDLAGTLPSIMAYAGFTESKAGGSRGGGLTHVARWQDIRGRLVTAGHVPVDRVGKVRWVDALDLFAFWRRHPPTDDLVAAYLGFKPPAEVAPKPIDSDDPSGIGGLISQFPSGFVPADR